MQLRSALGNLAGAARIAVPLPIMGVFLLWLAYSTYVFLHAGSLAADEISFLAIARENSYRFFLTAPPPGLYGSLFWIAVKLAGSPWIARFAVLLMFCAAPCLVIATIGSPRFKAIALLMWLTFPFAWWTGKLISPEIPALFLVSVSVYLFHTRRFVAASALIGLAIGVKLSAMPVAVYFALAYAFSSLTGTSARWRQAPWMLVAFAFALFASFPPLIEGLRQMTNMQAAPNALPLKDSVQQMLLRERWEWDAVFSGGFLHFGLMTGPLLVYASLLALKDWRAFIPFAAAFGAFVLLNLHSPTQYGWYWFPMLPIILYQITFIERHGRSRTTLLVLGLVVAVNAVQQVPLIIEFAHQKFAQIRIIGERDEIGACLRTQIAQRHPSTVYNIAEFGIHFDDTATTRFFYNPTPDALDADMELRGTRTLVSERQGEYLMRRGKRLQALCGDVMVLSKE